MAAPVFWTLKIPHPPAAHDYPEGLFHLCEHLLLKAAGGGADPSLSLCQRVEASGGRCSGMTDPDAITLSAVLSDKRAAESLSEWLTSLESGDFIVLEETIRRELLILRDELRVRQSNSTIRLYDAFMRAFFFPYQGETGTIERITPAIVQSAIAQIFSTRRYSLLIASPGQPAHQLRRHDEVSIPHPNPRPLSIRKMIPSKSPLSQVLVGQYIPAERHEPAVSTSLTVLKAILGSDYLSPLYELIRGGPAPCYRAEVSLERHRSGTALIIYAARHGTGCVDLLANVLSAFSAATSSLTRDQFEWAKKRVSLDWNLDPLMILGGDLKPGLENLRYSTFDTIVKKHISLSELNYVAT